jgi:chemotaxis protein MotB
MHSLKNETQLDIIQMKELANGDIVLTLPDTVLFRAGEAVLRPEARPFIQAISDVLIELDRHVRVEGHTDSVPISTVQFPSNWELSATRAVTVVRTLSEQYGLQADHLTAVGHADSRPLADNLTPEQRAKNRRVEIVVQEPRPVPQPIEPAEPQTALERFAAPQEAVKQEPSIHTDDIPPALLPRLPSIVPVPDSSQRTK